MRQLKINKSITNRENASLDKYLTDIGREGLIGPDEEVRLAQLIREGDRVALNQLVKANLRFVVSVAKQYQNQGLSLPDLINEGNVGLIKAASRFDETRGFKFISYAVWWIRQGILQALAEQSRIVRLPLNQVGSINKIKKTIAKLEQELNRAPFMEEVAESLETYRSKIDASMRISNRSLSIDAPLSSDDDTTMVDFITAKDAVHTDDLLMHESLNAEIKRSLATLTEKERDVINLYYGIGLNHGLTLDEIGDKFDLTRERVRQIKEKAIRRLKHSSRSKLLQVYLG
ncbi:MAG: RNA polymerase sigma factor RpoD/SigA [Bacteroidales bacterium]|nr:RNA polymerase sigma factor RpoD/SigA [Bacteroidales bacterium]